MRTVNIADTHSQNRPHHTIVLTMAGGGGDPWFTYLWVNDVCYTVSYYERDDDEAPQVTIERTGKGMTPRPPRGVRSAHRGND